MTKKIGWAIFLYGLLTFIISSSLIMIFLYNHFTKIQINQLKNEINLVATGVEINGKNYLDNLKLSDIRVTWIDKNGKVLYDSQKNSNLLDNHSNRMEIQQAYKLGKGQSIRYSKTLTKRLIYVAQVLKDDSTIRLSISQKAVLLFLIQMLPYISFIFIIILLLSIIIAQKTSKKIIAPLNELNLENPLSNKVYKELFPLLNKIDMNQKKLKVQENILIQKKEEFETIISKINEGMIILDKKGNIVTYNPSAQTLFELDKTYIEKNLVLSKRKLNLNDFVTKTLQGKKEEIILEVQNKHYKVLGNPISADKEEITGMIILLFDITEKIQLETLRREFTANVTHELRTPLQIMVGYSEILKQSKLSEEEVQLFSNKIYKESKRMIKLVEDILTLSQLDELSNIDLECVDLYELAKMVLESLKEEANKRKIKIFLEGEKILYNGNIFLLNSIIYNLCSNAIKYNIENGIVKIILKNEKNKIVLKVQDNGIGISSEDCQHIFERFYRADKSRSKKEGGTGLGLSIVKHAIQLHKANIFVESKLGKGTTMTINFPKEDDLV